MKEIRQMVCSKKDLRNPNFRLFNDFFLIIMTFIVLVSCCRVDEVKQVKVFNVTFCILRQIKT